ncbi:hypothetical protein CVT26_002295 [Gymnopilus dilepis]|uniref:pyranose dehydrogenase (acceptor) n=1 Tax=Gymnopilus dilepis TaxID=231916 RepID=A0A409WEA3_9AGAR|nr:hypothetical protein CVT26_002295 [Gymnopilus dilepis]
MHSSRLLSFVLASLFVAPSLGVTISSFSQLKTSTYDYVIVGAGTAGLVLANRLTEDPNVSVLVLEAVVSESIVLHSDQGVVAAEAPFLGPTLTPNTPYDYNYTVVPQVGMNHRTFAYPRGRLLGGSSSANYLFHQYGTFEDWNMLASVTGDSEWSWNNIKKYIQKANGHNTTGQFIPSLHGFNGVTSVSLPGGNYSIDQRVIAATQQLPEWPFNQDMSGGDHSLLGIGWLQSSAGGGVRSSSSTSYLAQANTRPNLTVLINATVLKLVQTQGSGSLKGFRSVQFGPSLGTVSNPAAAAPKTVTARKEVILAAGAIGTPQILKLSGIGDPSELGPLHIQTIVNNPSVGENLSDHTLLPNIFTVADQASTLDNFLRDQTDVNDAVQQWVQNKTGPFANNVVNTFGFSRLPSNAAIFKTTRDPAPGPNSPHWELILSNFWFNPGIAQPATGNYMTMVAVLIRPTSRGTVKLASNNPYDKPLIDPKYLTTDFDVFVKREAVKSIMEFAQAPAWKGYITGRFGNFASAQTDDQIDAYVRSLTTTIFHPFGTAAMSPANSKTGVTNPDLTVKGTVGLRIVDASVVPFVPSSHTQGPVYLLAERAADIIKAADHLN